MDFNEAEQRFHFLEDQRNRGVITLEQYRAELDLLRVTDAQGRLWMPQERTGQWYVHEGGQWRAAQPFAPQQFAQTPPPPPPPAAAVQFHPQPAQPQPRPQPVQPQTPPASPQADKGGGCGKTLLYLALWAVFWVIIAVAVFIFWGRDEPATLLGVGLAALISLVLLLGSLSSAWSGTIEDIRIEKVRTTDDEGYSHTRNERFAYVRRDNGKRKRMNAMPQWQVGDRLVKNRGETHVRHYPAQ
jgi:hypothetical protein